MGRMVGTAVGILIGCGGDHLRIRSAALAFVVYLHLYTVASEFCQ